MPYATLQRAIQFYDTDEHTATRGDMLQDFEEFMRTERRQLGESLQQFIKRFCRGKNKAYQLRQTELYHKIKRLVKGELNAVYEFWKHNVSNIEMFQLLNIYTTHSSTYSVNFSLILIRFSYRSPLQMKTMKTVMMSKVIKVKRKYPLIYQNLTARITPQRIVFQ